MHFSHELTLETNVFWPDGQLRQIPWSLPGWPLEGMSLEPLGDWGLCP